MGKMLVVDTRSGHMPARLVLPERPNGCGVVLAMSIWGLNTDLLSYARYMAALGYAVIVPNLFWREEPDHGVEYDVSQLGAISALMAKHTDQDSVADVRNAAGALRRVTDISRLGVVGWCYGGRIACLAGLEPGFDAVVGYYPTILETRLDIVGRMQAPLSLHLPEIEKFATRDDAIRVIGESFAEDANAEVFVYSAAHHGFGFSPPHASYDAEAARLANTRAALFLQAKLVTRFEVAGGSEEAA